MKEEEEEGTDKVAVPLKMKENKRGNNERRKDDSRKLEGIWEEGKSKGKVRK